MVKKVLSFVVIACCVSCGTHFMTREFVVLEAPTLDELGGWFFEPDIGAYRLMPEEYVRKGLESDPHWADRFHMRLPSNHKNVVDGEPILDLTIDTIRVNWKGNERPLLWLSSAPQFVSCSHHDSIRKLHGPKPVGEKDALVIPAGVDTISLHIQVRLSPGRLGVGRGEYCDQKDTILVDVSNTEILRQEVHLRMLRKESGSWFPL